MEPRTAIGRHLALAGFMGAGKTTIGQEVAALLQRPFVDTDEEIERRHRPIARIFAERGEEEFRRLEEELVAEVLCGEEPAVIALGGGAVLSERTRERLDSRAFTILIPVDADTAWERSRHSGRPLAADEEAFRRLHADRLPSYRLVTEDAALDSSDVEGVLLSCLRVEFGKDSTRPPDDVLVADEFVIGLYPHVARLARALHTLPEGESAKSLVVATRLWDELTGGRDLEIVAFGGGATIDVVGFVAATYLRGVEWRAIPTSLVAQVDAAIGGKTAINVRAGKNLVGAFHLPEWVWINPAFLGTLSEAQRREGMAEVVKTGLLAGQELWTLDDDAMVRSCAAFKCAVVVSDPYERGRRAILNLGHTFAHALETGSGHGTVSHGSAVALGLTAALRLSERHYGLDPGLREEVVRVLDPRAVAADRDLAWAALRRDKKAEAGRTRLVLLEAFGRPVYGVELPDDEVRAELDALIAG